MTKLLLPLLLLAGCSSTVWTETTETTRPVGEARETTETRPIANTFLEYRTATEADGYYHYDSVNTDERGRVNIDLLPAALQCLHYGHAVTIELRSYEDGEVLYSRVLDAAESREVVREWSVQAKLGAEIPMRRGVSKLVDFLIESTTDAELREQLEDIRLRTTLRMDWE